MTTVPSQAMPSSSIVPILSSTPQSNGPIVICPPPGGVVNNYLVFNQTDSKQRKRPWQDARRPAMAPLAIAPKTDPPAKKPKTIAVNIDRASPENPEADSTGLAVAMKPTDYNPEGAAIEDQSVVPSTEHRHDEASKAVDSPSNSKTRLDSTGGARSVLRVEDILGPDGSAAASASIGSSNYSMEPMPSPLLADAAPPEISRAGGSEACINLATYKDGKRATNVDPSVACATFSKTTSGKETMGTTTLVLSKSTSNDSTSSSVVEASTVTVPKPTITTTVTSRPIMATSTVHSTSTLGTSLPIQQPSAQTTAPSSKDLPSISNALLFSCGLETQSATNEQNTFEHGNSKLSSWVDYLPKFNPLNQPQGTTQQQTLVPSQNRADQQRQRNHEKASSLSQPMQQQNPPAQQGVPVCSNSDKLVSGNASCQPHMSSQNIFSLDFLRTEHNQQQYEPSPFTFNLGPAQAPGHSVINTPQHSTGYSYPSVVSTCSSSFSERLQSISMSSSSRSASMQSTQSKKSSANFPATSSVKASPALPQPSQAKLTSSSDLASNTAAPTSKTRPAPARSQMHQLLPGTSASKQVGNQQHKSARDKPTLHHFPDASQKQNPTTQQPQFYAAPQSSYFGSTPLVPTEDQRETVNLSNSIFELNPVDNYWNSATYNAPCPAVTNAGNTGYSSTTWNQQHAGSSYPNSNRFWTAPNPYASEATTAWYPFNPEPASQPAYPARYGPYEQQDSGFSFQLKPGSGNSSSRNSGSRSSKVQQTSVASSSQASNPSGTFHIANMLPEVSVATGQSSGRATRRGQHNRSSTSQGITHKLDEQFVKHQVSEFSMEWNPNVELSSACGCALERATTCT